MSEPFSIRILGQDYKIKCESNKTAELEESAVYLNNLMQEIRDASNITNVERVAVIAALNMAHELLFMTKQKDKYIEFLDQRIQHIQHKIEHALASDAS